MAQFLLSSQSHSSLCFEGPHTHGEHGCGHYKWRVQVLVIFLVGNYLLVTHWAKGYPHQGGQTQGRDSCEPWVWNEGHLGRKFWRFGLWVACPLDPTHLLPQAKGTVEKARMKPSRAWVVSRGPSFPYLEVVQNGLVACWFIPPLFSYYNVWMSRRSYSWEEGSAALGEGFSSLLWKDFVQIVDSGIRPSIVLVGLVSLFSFRSFQILKRAQLLAQIT